MSKNTNGLSDDMMLKVQKHSFKEFPNAFMVGNTHGKFCGNIGIFVEHKNMSDICCPKVFRTKTMAEKFIANELTGE